MKLRIGDRVTVGEDEFVVTGMQVNHGVNGRSLGLSGLDPEGADKLQRQAIEHDKATDFQSKMLEVLKDLIDKGGQYPPFNQIEL